MSRMKSDLKKVLKANGIARVQGKALSSLKIADLVTIAGKHNLI